MLKPLKFIRMKDRPISYKKQRRMDWIDTTSTNLGSTNHQDKGHKKRSKSTYIVHDTPCLINQIVEVAHMYSSNCWYGVISSDRPLFLEKVDFDAYMHICTESYMVVIRQFSLFVCLFGWLFVCLFTIYSLH